MFATVGFLHLADVPVEVGVGPTDELRALALAVLVAVPETIPISRLTFMAVRFFQKFYILILAVVQWLGKQMTTR